MARMVQCFSLSDHLMTSLNRGLSAGGFQSTRINSESTRYFSSCSKKPLKDTCIRRNALPTWSSFREEMTILKYGLSLWVLMPFFGDALPSPTHLYQSAATPSISKEYILLAISQSSVIYSGVAALTQIGGYWAKKAYSPLTLIVYLSYYKWS